MTPTTLLPFLYPQSALRQLTSSARRRILLLRLLRQSSTLTSATARTILDTELSSPPDPPATAQTHYRSPPPFLDALTLTLHSGPGGHGCVSFLRDKFISHGPPNGGDGGRGGDVYIVVDRSMVGSLHKLRGESNGRGGGGVLKAGKGANGMGSNRNGRKGEDLVIRVPVGTVVREVERAEAGEVLPSLRGDEGDIYDRKRFDGDVYNERGFDGDDGDRMYDDRDHDDNEHPEAAAEEEDPFIFRGTPTPEEIAEAELSTSNLEKIKQRKKKRYPRRFAKSNIDDPDSEYIHYPLSMAANLNSLHFPPPDPPQHNRRNYLPQVQGPIDIDFAAPLLSPSITSTDTSIGGGGEEHLSPTEIQIKKLSEPILILRGGFGGLGNPNFVTQSNRRPLFATKGEKASILKIKLELKLLADVGLVGRPNVGKSSLLRCLTGSRARVGDWAFTTLKPNLGTVVVDGGVGVGDISYDRGHNGSEIGNGGGGRERFTIADIPGLVKDAGENKGLGWDFLRHVERARGLVFVLDLGFDPVMQLEGLWKDIKGYEKMRELELQQRVQEEEDEKARMAADRRRQGNSEEEFGEIIDVIPDDVSSSIGGTGGEGKRESELESISNKPWMVVANKADLPGAKDWFLKLKSHLQKLYEEKQVKEEVACIAVCAAKAGMWREQQGGQLEGAAEERRREERKREEEVWRGVVKWFRGLVG